jgi:hypothetical protein
LTFRISARQLRSLEIYVLLLSSVAIVTALVGRGDTGTGPRFVAIGAGIGALAGLWVLAHRARIEPQDS